MGTGMSPLVSTSLGLLRYSTGLAASLIRIFFLEKVSNIKLRHNVYVDTLWNTPACQVIIICLTANSKQFLAHNIC